MILRAAPFALFSFLFVCSSCILNSLRKSDLELIIKHFEHYVECFIYTNFQLSITFGDYIIGEPAYSVDPLIIYSNYPAASKAKG